MPNKTEFLKRMCDFCRRGISITLFYPSHNVTYNLLRRQFYSNKQNCLFTSKIKSFILKPIFTQFRSNEASWKSIFKRDCLKLRKLFFETFVILSVWPTFLFIVSSRNGQLSFCFCYLLLPGFCVFLKLLCVWPTCLFRLSCLLSQPAATSQRGDLVNKQAQAGFHAELHNL